MTKPIPAWHASLNRAKDQLLDMVDGGLECQGRDTQISYVIAWIDQAILEANRHPPEGGSGIPAGWRLWRTSHDVKATMGIKSPEGRETFVNDLDHPVLYQLAVALASPLRWASWEKFPGYFEASKTFGGEGSRVDHLAFIYRQYDGIFEAMPLLPKPQRLPSSEAQ